MQADEELFLVAMEHQIGEHKRKGLMPEDPRGNFTITSIANELDSFKFRVLEGAARALPRTRCSVVTRACSNSTQSRSAGSHRAENRKGAPHGPGSRRICVPVAACC